ncbi:MAG: sulfatase-like hydrolase/transferase [candidate division Zixibacteria bacterium]|nr:sulfatase-like hydrolase/transferase [candidate division Zixibacteria bacterium]
MYDIRKKASFLSHISIAISAGIFTGVILALWESIAVILAAGELNEIWLVPYGVLYYGLLFAVIGLFFGIGGGIFTRIIGWDVRRGTAFLLYFVILSLAINFRVVKYKYYQLVMKEQGPYSIFDWLAILAIALILVIALAAIWRLLARVGVVRAMSGVIGAIVWYIGIAVVTIIIAAVYSAGGPEIPDKPALASKIPGKNIIYIIIDTLRYDRLSINGYNKISTPNIDSLAVGAINYKHHYAQSSWTKPQIATLLTGMYPSSHRAIGKADILPGAVYTIAEHFADNGYYTVGIVDNVNITEAFNFQQGFDEFYFLKPEYYFWATESVYKLSLYSLLRRSHEKTSAGDIWPEHYYQPAEVVSDEAIGWLDRNKDKRFFMLLHYMDPHDPFFEHPFNGTGYARAAQENPPGSVAQTYSDAYDEEIVYHDEMLGRVFEHLKGLNLYDSSIIVVTADHGEEFYEHGGWWHGYTLYNEGIRVPLIIKPPAGTYEPAVDTSFVRSIDVPPSILGLVEHKTPDTWQGQNIFNRKEEPSLVFAEEILTGNIIHSVMNREWKYIEANEDNPRGLQPQELYKMPEDSLEMNNLAAERQDVVKELKEALELKKLIAAGQAVESEETDIDEATRERLKALGYLK